MTIWHCLGCLKCTLLRICKRFEFYRLDYLFLLIGIVLLISGDFDFAPTLRFLRKRGFKILLAQTNIGGSLILPDEAHLSWRFEGMQRGEGPRYFREF